MIFTEPISFDDAIKSRQVKAILPTEASSRQLMDISAEVRERALFSARTTNASYLMRVNNVITQIVSPETIIDPLTGEKRPARPGEYMDPATARLQLKKALAAISYEPDPAERGTLKDLSSDLRLNLIIETNTKMAQGYGYWQQGQNQEVLDAFPAQELFRAEIRDEPRDWISRWRGAGGQLYAGRMIAKKNDPIWTRISTFGLPYPPFDFNSGMDVMDVARDEAISLGVIQADIKIEPEQRPFNEDVWKDVSQEERQGALFDALVESLGDSAEFTAEGVLRLKTK